jgi:uncharacterized membrane-anchored protein
MTTKVSRMLIAAAVLLVLAAVDWSIVAKERIKTHGEIILLELAPVDPRSLMQGDYMALRFELAQQISPEQGGLAPLTLDEHRVARLDPSPQDARLHIRFRVRNGQVWLGTNAYFFEEGRAERLNGARYGEFHLDPETGEAVLTALRDAEFRKL